MKKIFAFSAAILVSGAAWAGSWDQYSESISSAYYMDYLGMREASVAGQPGAGDSAVPGPQPDRVRTEEAQNPFANSQLYGSILNDIGHRF